MLLQHTCLVQCRAATCAAIVGWDLRDSTGGIWAADATHVKALGPPIAALLLSTLPAADILFIGDSSHVIDCISNRCRPPDLFLYHCIEMCRNLLPNCLITTAWVPREVNTLNQGKGRKLIVPSPTRWGGYHDAIMRFLEVRIDFESNT